MDIQSGFQESISIAGITVLKSSTLILTSNARSGNYSTLRRKGVNYQVPAGKILKIISSKSMSASATSACELGYGDDAKNDTTIPANAVSYTCGGYNNYALNSYLAYRDDEQILDFEVPAGKYPFIKAVGGTWFCNLICILVDV